MRKLWLVVVLGWFIPITTFALWAEPSCDPAVDPTTCNISAPLNVSSSDQTKDGGLAINGTLTANGSSIFASTGTLTADGSTLIRGPLTVQNTTIFSNPYMVAVNGVFTYSGAAGSFILTADSIDDSEVSDTLTASIFVGTGSTSDAIDLATAEVSGMLSPSSVTDVWVNTTGDTMTGTLTFAPTSSVDAISITPYADQEAIYISGSSTQPLVSLNPTGTGRGLYVNMTTGVANGIYALSSAGYPISVIATASATRGVNVVNNAAGGYGVYSVASSATGGIGVFGRGNTGYGGYFSSGTTSGSALYADLTSASTTTSSKALEVVGKNGYGGYFTADGNQSTALYAENTNNTAGFSKYGIQTTATTPAGEGIYAVSDYGRAGHFESNSGGTGVYVDGTGATYGIELNASGGTAGIDVDTTDGTTGIDISTAGIGLNIATNSTTANAPGIVISANGGQKGIEIDASSAGIDVDTTSGLGIEANDTDIHTTGGYRGGQFYPNERAAQGGYPNIEPINISKDTLELRDNSDSMLYTGNELLILENSDIYDAEVARYNVTTGDRIHDSATGFGPDAADMVLVQDSVYVFDDDTDDYYAESLRDGSSSSGITGATAYPVSVTSDGDDVWIGTSNSIQEWTNFSGSPSTRVSSTGNIADIIYADGYIWAASSTYDVVRKVDATSFSSTSITVGDNPGMLLYDGAHVWVVNRSGNSLTRINPSTNETDTYDTTSVSTNPTSLVFDGANIWVGFASGQEIGYFNVASETWGATTVSGTGNNIGPMAFDGTNIWYLTKRSSALDVEDLYKIPTGSGFGTGIPQIHKGFLVYSTSDTVYCIYVNGTTLTASTTLTNCQ